MVVQMLLVGFNFYQLYCDYMLCAGEGGPLHLQVSEDPLNRPTESLLGLSFTMRCRWFTRLLRVLWKDWGYSIEYAFARPHANQLILHTACDWLPWPERLATMA